MDKKTVDLALRLWDQAGERPYEVLREEGLLEGFVEFLGTSRLKVGTIFRGTFRHRELEVGQQLEYSYPTSWSSSLEKAYNFVEHLDDAVIICLIANKKLRAVSNKKNTYGEKEVIVHPIVLTVTKKRYFIFDHLYEGGVCILEVEELQFRNPHSLVELCSKVCPKDNKLLKLPIELIEKVERYMTKDEQILVFSRYKSWYKKTGILEELRHYKEGKKDGKSESWYKNGGIRRQF